MANWCMTNIDIHCTGKEQAKNFYKLLEEWTSKPFLNKDWDLKYLGNIIGNSGLEKWTDEGFSYTCRGRVSEINLSENVVNITTETAWTPCLQMWKDICEKYVENAEILYSAEEPGMQIYCTNNPDTANKYVLDSYEDTLESSWCISKDDLLKTLKSYFHEDNDNLDYYINKTNTEDCGIVINAWEFEDMSVWD